MLSLRPREEQPAVPGVAATSRKPWVPADEHPQRGSCSVSATGASQAHISALRGLEAAGGTVTPNGHKRSCDEGRMLLALPPRTGHRARQKGLGKGNLGAHMAYFRACKQEKGLISHLGRNEPKPLQDSSSRM